MQKTTIILALLTGLAASVNPSLALTVPYTETFSSAAANWSSGATFTALDYPASGGPDGSAYGSRSTSFVTNPVNDIPILFRGQSNFNSSGNNLFGDWIGGGVSTFSFSVRHDAATPVTFFARFAPGASPGVVALIDTPVQPNTWTTFTIPIDPSYPFVYEGTSFGIFSNVNRVQVGVITDANIAGTAGPYAFDIDNVSIVPAPGIGAMTVGLLGVLGRRRRR